MNLLIYILAKNEFILNECTGNEEACTKKLNDTNDERPKRPRPTDTLPNGSTTAISDGYTQFYVI